MKYRNIEDRLPAEAVAAGRAAFPENPAEARALTDLGNAERLIDRFGTVLRYCPPRGCWYVWDGSCWNEDKTGEVVRLAKQSVRAIADEAERADPERQKAILKHARQSEQAARLEAAIKLATTERGIPVMPDELDADPWALNVANGTIDLRTGKLRPHCPKDLLTKICPVAYDPSARSAVWDAFLKAATKGDKELEAYLQRMTGRALQGEVVEKAFWFFYGPPDGMKSTFINAISKTLGSYAAPAAFTTWLVQTHIGGNRGDLVALRGARLVTSVEVRRDARFDEATLKAVTGGDALKAAAKYEKEIELRPTFALWLAGNDAPRIRDDDAGAWSRVRRVPFCNPLPAEQRDPSMGEKLAAPEVKAAILAWAVRGCLDWQAAGKRVGACPAVEQSSNEYRAEMDRAAGFFAERCVFDARAKVPAAQLRGAYEAWCTDEGVRPPLSTRALGDRLQERGCKPTRTGGQRFWCGVRLRYPDEAGGRP